MWTGVESGISHAGGGLSIREFRARVDTGFARRRGFPERFESLREFVVDLLLLVGGSAWLPEQHLRLSHHHLSQVFILLRGCSVVFVGWQHRLNASHGLVRRRRWAHESLFWLGQRNSRYERTFWLLGIGEPPVQQEFFDISRHIPVLHRGDSPGVVGHCFSLVEEKGLRFPEVYSFFLQDFPARLASSLVHNNLLPFFCRWLPSRRSALLSAHRRHWQSTMRHFFRPV